MDQQRQEHLEERILIQYADDPASLPYRAAVEAHLASCADCTAGVDDFRLLAEAMQDEETWWAVEQLERDSDPVREFISRRETEDAEAEQLLQHLLSSPYRFTSANIARKAKYQTGGVVRLLCESARQQCASDPKFALALAETACVIAEALPDDYYPAGTVNELRGNAWKDYSTGCRLLSRVDEGFDALDRAERAYRRLLNPQIQLGVVDLCRGLLHFEREHYDDGLRFVRAAAEVFEKTRETTRYFEAKEVEAIILHYKGDVATARATYQKAFELADSIGDADMKARSARNLGVAYRDAGDIAAASKYFLIALQIYEGMDKRAMVVHTRWSIARLTLAAGNAAEAALRLPPLATQLAALGMTNDAARAQLDVAEAQLILGRYAEVEATCSQLFAFFRQAKLLTGAMTAAAYLGECAAQRKLTPRHIEHVRKYLTKLERAPDLVFAPPPE